MAIAMMCNADWNVAQPQMTEITDQCYHKSYYRFVPNVDTNTFSVIRTDDTPYHTIWIPCHGKHKYRVECTLMFPFSMMPYYCFLFIDPPTLNLVVTANNESVMQYVTQVSDTAYIIETPEDCWEAGITYTVECGIKVYLLEG